MKLSYKIVLFLEKNKVNLQDDIRKGLEVNSLSQVSQQVNNLLDKNIITRAEYGIYVLTPLGKSVAKAIKKLNEVNFLETYNRSK